MSTFSQVYKPYARGGGVGVTQDVRFWYLINDDIQSFLSVLKPY